MVSILQVSQGSRSPTNSFFFSTFFPSADMKLGEFMHRRIISSRQRFPTYLKDLRERQRAGNGRPRPESSPSESNGKLFHHPASAPRGSWSAVFRLDETPARAGDVCVGDADDLDRPGTRAARRDQVRDRLRPGRQTHAGVADHSAADRSPTLGICCCLSRRRRLGFR